MSGIRNDVGKMTDEQIDMFLAKHIDGDDTISRLKEIIKHVKSTSTIDCDRYSFDVIMDYIEDGMPYIIMHGTMFTHGCHMADMGTTSKIDAEKWLTSLGESDSFARNAERLPVIMVLVREGEKYVRTTFKVQKTVMWGEQ